MDSFLLNQARSVDRFVTKVRLGGTSVLLTKLRPLALAALLVAAPLAHTAAALTTHLQTRTTQTASTPTASTTWAALATLPPGARLRITLKSGEKLKAAFDSADDDTLIVSVGAREQRIARPDVRSIYQVRGSLLKPTLIGAGIGGGAGAGIGGATAGVFTDGGASGTSNGAVAAASGALFAGIGAGIGALIGSSRRKRTLVYQAP